MSSTTCVLSRGTPDIFVTLQLMYHTIVMTTPHNRPYYMAVQYAPILGTLPCSSRCYSYCTTYATKLNLGSTHVYRPSIALDLGTEQAMFGGTHNTWRQACCPQGDGVVRSYAEAHHNFINSVSSKIHLCLLDTLYILATCVFTVTHSVRLLTRSVT